LESDKVLADEAVGLFSSARSIIRVRGKVSTVVFADKCQINDKGEGHG
jgi:hypothetical protein